MSCQTLSRRSFVSSLVGGSAGVTSLMALRPLLAGSTSRAFRLGACDWNLGRRADPSSFDVAKQIGLDGVQISMGTLSTNDTRKPQVQQAYRDAMQRTGLEIASLAIPETNRVPLKSDPTAARWLNQSIDVCTALGLTITMPACFAAGDLDMARPKEIDHLVGVLRDVAPKAEKAGVVIALEDYLSAADNMKIIDRVGSPALKVYYDVGNSTDKGYDILAEIRELGRRDLISQLHAKDGPHRLGHGRIDFREVRKALDDINYSGWIVIEAVAPDGVVPTYTQYRKQLREIFPR